MEISLYKEQDFGHDPLKIRDTEHYQKEYVQTFVEKWDDLIDWDARAESESGFFIQVLKAAGKRKIRDRVPMHFVTPEPYIGHLGLDGVGDTKGLMESELRSRHISWTTNARIDEVAEGRLRFTEVDEDGKDRKSHERPFRHAMILPAFKGIDAIAGIAVWVTCSVLLLIMMDDPFQFAVRWKYILLINAFVIATAIWLAQFVGAALAAELGTMRVTEQIDALRTLATHPVDYLVLPRVVASVNAAGTSRIRAPRTARMRYSSGKRRS